MKICATCQQSKDESEYYMNRVGERVVRRNECKPCLRIRQAAGRFGLTLPELHKMYADQNHRCAICKEKCDIFESLSIDHDHKCCSGKGRSCGKCVRGLLCAQCNHGLGNFKDDPKLLEEAIKYLGI